MDQIARETDFFKTLNRIVEPMVRAGLGNPTPCASGVILLETQGRISGRTREVPLLAAAFGDLVIVSTVRGSSSQWLQNVIASPRVRYWSHGRPRGASAFVVADGQLKTDGRKLPFAARGLLLLLSSIAAWNPFAFAVLIPETA
jgi:deazaflavin-dependent oxidoreductase (nitroreductase family)